MIFCCVVSFKSKKKNIPDLSLPPCIFGYFSENLCVSVCFGLLRNRSVCFGCFDTGSKHRNKPKIVVFGFTKQTETNAKQILFRFVSVRTEIYFCLFRGHPSRGGEDTLAGWRGGWGVNILEVVRHSSVLYVCMYFVSIPQRYKSTYYMRIA
jgi:hypothetical protein